MDKIGMREWVASLEEILDKKLNKWRKESRIENGEAVQVEWQFEQTHVILDIFWKDGEESVHLQYFAPRASHKFIWHGLNDKTVDRITDRIGNLAQVTMYPAVGLDHGLNG